MKEEKAQMEEKMNWNESEMCCIVVLYTHGIIMIVASSKNKQSEQ